jgi:transketolase
VEAAEVARRTHGRPTLVICRTHIGHGSPNKQDTAEAHGAALGEEEVRLTKRALGWPEDARFLVPDEVRRHLLEAGRRGGSEVESWERRMSAWRHARPEAAAAFDRALAGVLPEGWDGALPSFPAGKKVATRKASGDALNALAARVPALMGGSADLTESNNTEIKGGGAVRRGEYAGRNLHFGVREHAMGAVLSGLALHGGLRPFGGTFLIFSDYMRPSIRLAAMMRLPVIYVFTHDSIGLGEDGPTHQPVEHLASLRAIPGLTVIRPADAAETVEAWRAALGESGPVALILTRQGLVTLDRSDGRLAPASRLARGAYVLRDASDARVSLIATGSEVETALAAADLLAAKAVRARVVSFPCWSFFERLSEEERQAVLGPGVRVAVEAAASFGWHRWVGASGRIVGLDRFGASAPGPRVQKELGFSPENVAHVALEALGRE